MFYFLFIHIYTFIQCLPSLKTKNKTLFSLHCLKRSKMEGWGVVVKEFVTSSFPLQTSRPNRAVHLFFIFRLHLLFSFFPPFFLFFPEERGRCGNSGMALLQEFVSLFSCRLRDSTTAPLVS